MAINQCLLVSESWDLLEFLNKTTFQILANIIRISLSTYNIDPGFLRGIDFLMVA